MVPQIADAASSSVDYTDDGEEYKDLNVGNTLDNKDPNKKFFMSYMELR
jgi:hypothetical protein